jgi:hypothetical protein
MDGKMSRVYLGVTTLPAPVRTHSARNRNQRGQTVLKTGV